MELTLTWDLFIVVFFGLIVTYSFIIGKHETVKIVVVTYIAILAVQGIGNILQTVSGESQPALSILGLSVDITLLGGAKLVIFIATMVFLAVRGGLEIQYSKEPNAIVSMVLTGVFGFATAGLLLLTLITYIADKPLLDRSLVEVPSIAALTAQSALLQMIVVYQDLWFSLPAILLIAVGFLGNEQVE